MCTRMTHPNHGSTHAYGESEVQRLRGYGWVPDDELNQPKAAEAEPATEHPARKKPGPKPKVRE
jgi:hypothetical protein